MKARLKTRYEGRYAVTVFYQGGSVLYKFSSIRARFNFIKRVIRRKNFLRYKKFDFNYSNELKE